MKYKYYFFTLVLSLIVQCAFGQTGEKKNLLFIITDQQRYSALSYAGNEVIHTPNLDRIAQQGAYFKNAYTQCAVCGPARSSILTGYNVEHTGVYSNEQTYDYDDASVMTMPTFDQILADYGYHCEYYGKWHAMTHSADAYKNPDLYANNGRSVFGSGGQSHIWKDELNTLGSPPTPGDGEFVDGMSKYPYIVNPLDRYFGKTWDELQIQGLIHSQPDQHGELQLDKEYTLTAFQAKQTLEAIERLKDSTFSITCSFHFPHSPMLAPEPYYSMYPVDDMLIPFSINDDMLNSPYVSSNSRESRTEYADTEKIKYMISEYYALITEIDDWVGEILDKLDELGIADNTMIIFTSDHGEMLGSHGMREKNVFYEESAHIPLLISNPGEISAGTTVEGYVSLIDLFPTILDYMGVPEHPSDGLSLRALMEGDETDHGEYVVTEWDRDNISNYMVIKDGWKLVIPYTIKSNVINAMYDLNTDPYEMTNLLGSNPNKAQYLDEAEDLRACLLEWLGKRNSIHYYSVSQRDLLNGGKPTGNASQFVSQDIPELIAGESISVSITMKNSGSSAWTKRGQFKLGSQSPADNEIWGIQRIELEPEDSIVPGGNKTFSFDVIVPDIDGQFNFQWQMIQDGEEWFGEKSEIVQVLNGNPGGFLDDCDDKTDWKSSVGLVLNTSDHQQGEGCLEFAGGSTDEFKKYFSIPYNCYGSVSGTELHFWYYISDVSQLTTNNQVELGSGGRNDMDEFNWNLQLSDLSNGWNYVILKVSEANTSGSPDINAINWLRIYRKKNEGANVTTRLDGIQLIDPAVGPLYTLIVEGGQGSGNYPEGVDIGIEANDPPIDMKFDSWIVESGDITIQDKDAAITTITMGAGSGIISASYRDATSVHGRMKESNEYYVFPNPAETHFNIQLDLLQKAENMQLSLVDLSGRELCRKFYESGVEKDDILVFPFTGITSGTYLLKILVNNRSTSKLVFIS